MTPRLPVLAAMLAALLVGSAGPATARKAAAPVTNYRLVLLWRGPEFTDLRTPRSDSLLAGHDANIRRMTANGVLLACGPFQEDGALLGAFVCRDDSADDLEAELGLDPAISAGRLRAEILTWSAPAGIGGTFAERQERDPLARDSLVTFPFVLLHRGPAWTANAPRSVQRVLHQHARHVESLVGQGLLPLAGSILGTGDLRGVLVFAADPAAAARGIREDPAVKAGRFVPQQLTWWVVRGTVPGH